MAELLTPPYVSFTSFKAFISKFREHTLPGVLDGAVFSGIDGTTQSQLRTALKFLGLMDEGKRPTPLLQVAVENIQTDDWPDVLKALVEDSYAELFKSCKLESATPRHLEAAFESTYSMANNVAKKALTFVVQAAQEAKIPLSSWLVNRPRGGKGGKRTRKRENGSDLHPKGEVASPMSESKTGVHQSHVQHATGALTAAELVSRLPIAEMKSEDQAAAWKLILYLKGKESKSHDNDDEDREDAS